MLSSMDDVLRQHLDSVVRRVRARLATRRLVQGAVYGVVAGLGLAIPTVLVLTRVVPPSRLVLVGSLASAGLVATAVLIGASVSLLRRSLQRTEVAQLLDKALGTEEAWLTAQWLLDDTAAPRREELLQGLQARLESPAIAGMLRLRVPRAGRAVPVLLALLVGVFFLPPGLLAARHTASTPEGQEGERLAERLGEVEQEAKGAPLPDAIESGLDSLSDELAGEEITADEAVKRIEDLQEQLDRFTEEMKPTTDLLDELERAADELAASQPDLSEALRNADMDAAADALEDLAKQGGMTADEKKQLGERMSDAGEQLAGSQDPAMREAGEALKQAGQQLGQEGAQQASQQGGQQGGQQPMSPETQQRMEQLRDQIEKNRELGERLQQDQKALERAQRTNGALEASRQRLGGESDPRERGESSQGEGQEGTDGQGEGQDDGQGRQGAQG
ncbi:MAG: hypothetical protein KC656_06630, partial [Myxococcales bacterium]|nr:hypothetical protein [Myxococcales bacterium]